MQRRCHKQKSDRYLWMWKGRGRDSPPQQVVGTGRIFFSTDIDFCVNLGPTPLPKKITRTPLNREEVFQFLQTGDPSQPHLIRRPCSSLLTTIYINTLKYIPMAAPYGNIQIIYQHTNNICNIWPYFTQIAF